MVMGYIVMAYIVMAYVGMAFMVMAYIGTGMEWYLRRLRPGCGLETSSEAACRPSVPGPADILVPASAHQLSQHIGHFFCAGLSPSEPAPVQRRKRCLGMELSLEMPRVVVLIAAHR